MGPLFSFIRNFYIFYAKAAFYKLRIFLWRIPAAWWYIPRQQCTALTVRCYYRMICKNNVFHHNMFEAPMVYNTYKTLTAELRVKELPEGGCRTMSYIYEEEETEFDGRFKFVLPGLHEMLFGELTIILRGSRRTVTGIARLRLKWFLEGDGRRLEIDIARPSYLKKAEFYERDFRRTGALEGVFCLSSSAMPPVGTHCTTGKGLVGLLFPGEAAQMYRIAYELFQATQKGTLLCRMHWVFGLISAEYYYNYIYGECRLKDDDSGSKTDAENEEESTHTIDSENIPSREAGSHVSKEEESTEEADASVRKDKFHPPGSCGMPFCRRSYKKLSSRRLKTAVETLQYAAAAFANSIVTWRLERRRDMPDICDERRKAILDRLDIEDTDFFIDAPGDANSLAYIAFFSRGRLVISFKGTTRGVEAVHDLNCDYAEFLDGFVHRGFKLLAQRFVSTAWPPLAAEMHRRGVSRILLTGHSLGAAAAILVCLLLEHSVPGIEAETADSSETTHSDHSVCDSHSKSSSSLSSNGDSLTPPPCTIRVVVFGTPPVVSASIADHPHPNITVYNYGCDIVTRLNFGSVLDLKYICISISNLYDYFTDKKLVVKKIAEIKQHIARTNHNTKLYTPGCLIHIKDFGSNTFLYKKVHYTFFEDIICSRRAPFDHIIHKTMNAFKQSLKEKKDRNAQNK